MSKTITNLISVISILLLVICAINICINWSDSRKLQQLKKEQLILEKEQLKLKIEKLKLEMEILNKENK